MVYHAMEYYSAIKRNKVLILAIKWMNLESITSCKISQIQRDKYCIVSLI
jgi:hypothetical protein